MENGRLNWKLGSSTGCSGLSQKGAKKGEQQTR